MINLGLSKYALEIVLKKIEEPIVISIIAKEGLTLDDNKDKLIRLAIDEIEEDEDSDIWEEDLYEDGIMMENVLKISLINVAPLDPMDEDWDPCEECGIGQIINHISFGWHSMNSKYLCEDCYEHITGRND